MLSRLKKEFADLKAQWARVRATTQEAERSAKRAASIAAEKEAVKAARKVKAEFVLDPKIDVPYGTTGSLRASYRELERVLGKPHPNREDSDNKISTAWALKNPETGDVVEIHDWKTTNLYDQRLPSVAAFRRKPSYEWSIAASSKAVVTQFVAWFRRQKSKSTSTRSTATHPKRRLKSKRVA